MLNKYTKGLLKEYARFFSIIMRLLDVIAVIGTGIISYYSKFGHFTFSIYYLSALAVSSVLTLLVFSELNIYESVRVQSFWQYLIKLSQAVLIVLMLLAGLAFLTKTGQDFSRYWFVLWGVSFLIFLILFRCVLYSILRIMRTKGFNERHVIIIGVSDLTHQLVQAIQQSLWTGFHIVEIFDDQSEHPPKDIHGIPVRMMPDELPVSIDEVWIALSLASEARLKKIMHKLRHRTITTRLVLDLFGMELFNHSITHLAGMPVINIRATPMVGLNRIIKAMEDRILASLILLFISPLLVMIAIAIKFTSPGPIFYKQKRMGWNGKEFTMLKFRTMPVNAESTSGPVWAKKDENRATAVGAFLRKTSLDELPQFINVLCGSMSIVGPRPERPVFVEQFKDEIPGYMQKHFVKACITGWAQVNGWRGNTCLNKRIQYDLYYIENWSLTFDLKIIFLTFFRGFIHKNAY